MYYPSFREAENTLCPDKKTRDSFTHVRTQNARASVRYVVYTFQQRRISAHSLLCYGWLRQLSGPRKWSLTNTTPVYVCHGGVVKYPASARCVRAWTETPAVLACILCVFMRVYSISNARTPFPTPVSCIFYVELCAFRNRFTNDLGCFRNVRPTVLKCTPQTF